MGTVWNLGTLGDPGWGRDSRRQGHWLPRPKKGTDRSLWCCGEGETEIPLLVCVRGCVNFLPWFRRPVSPPRSSDLYVECSAIGIDELQECDPPDLRVCPSSHTSRCPERSLGHEVVGGHSLPGLSQNPSWKTVSVLGGVPTTEVGWIPALQCGSFRKQ